MRLARFAALAGCTVAAWGCSSASEPAEPTGSEAAAIVGGYVDEETKGAVGLGINILDIYFMGHCSGSLLTPNLVLTAQHCVSLTEDETPTGAVECGRTDFGMAAGNQVFRVTTETVRPEEDGPEFYPGAVGRVRVPPETDNLCGFDVALIVLEGAGIPAKEATPLVPRIDSSPPIGDEYSAIGYGLTAPTGGSSGTRMRIDGNPVTCVGEACGSQVWPSEWRGESPTCPGDSGGPAIDAQGRVMGVLSRGPAGCTSSVYGDVAAWKDFLIEAALEAAELGGIEPPFWALTGESTPPPPADPGEPCLGVCVAGFVCAQDRGARICLPACDPDAGVCPEDYACDTVRGACLPVPDSGDDDSGCTVSAAPRGSTDRLGLLALAALLLGRGRRRRAAPR